MKNKDKNNNDINIKNKNNNSITKKNKNNYNNIDITYSEYELQMLLIERNKKMEFRIYILCLITIFLGLIGVITLNILDFEPTDINISCQFYELLHIYCPGCGGTRAFTQMIHGHFIKSIMYHPFVLYTTYLMLYFTIRYSIYLISKKKIKKMNFKEGYAYFGIALIFIQWIIKLVLLLVFHIPMPK